MNSWQSQKLDAWVNSGAIELGRGDIISKDDITAQPGPYPIYSSSAQNNGKFGEYAKYMFEEELITWSVDGGGDFFYRPKHRFSVTNVSGYMRIKSRELHAPFIYYCLADQHKRLTFDYTTKAHPSVIRKLYSLPKVEPAVQRKVARILQTVEASIEATEALIEKYQQIKAGLMHDLFTRGIGADDKLRPPREQAPELYQQTPIGWIPKAWTLERLDQQLQIIDCKHVTPTYRDDGFPIIRPRNISNDGLDFDNVDYVSPKDYRSLTDVHVPRMGDIVYSRNASFGVPCFVDTNIAFAIGQDVVVMTQKVMNTRYAFYLLKSSVIWQQISRLFAGSTFGRINLGDIRNYWVPVPKEDEQAAIASKMKGADERIEGERDNRDKLQKLKSGLMHDLLTGKVRVKLSEQSPEMAGG